jgi:hypothetical protein
MVNGEVKQTERWACKSLLIVVLMLAAGCQDNRVPLKYEPKVDIESEAYRDMVSRIVRAKLMELELQHHHEKFGYGDERLPSR